MKHFLSSVLVEKGQGLAQKGGVSSPVVSQHFGNKASPVAQRLCAHAPLRRPGVHRFGSRVWTWHRVTSHAVVGIPHIK